MTKFVTLLFAALFGSSFALARDSYQMKPEQVTLAQVATELKKNGQDRVLLSQMVGLLRSWGLEEDSVNKIQLQIKKYLASAPDNLQEVPHFPIVPVVLFQQIRPALLRMDRGGKPAPLNLPLEQELEAMFSPECLGEAASFKEILPDLNRGHFRNVSLSDCEIQQSQKLARVLTGLSEGEAKGRPLFWDGQTISQAADIFRYLESTNHTVALKVERTIADFIALNYKGSSVIWPIWIDTGLTLNGGKKLVVPAGHSQLSWEIRGPQINADVVFFLGADGMAFYPRVNMRPQWTGWNYTTVAETRTDEGKQKINDTVAMAESYLRRNRSESKGLKNNGYGYVGVCNDSVGYFEYALGLKLSVYPLVRNSELRKRGFGQLNDGWDELFAQTSSLLPEDQFPATAPQDRREALLRIQKMLPVTGGSLVDIDPNFEMDVESLNSELKNREL